ncbi:lipopolysaccharide biosynthesis protein [Pseudonocardia sp.]|uniref:lipopolysaccharide biosynthesis protein n=1 Tax=Pseudonocardia sp. TaxID=60912 RepID=UPI003D0B39D3
MRSLRVPAALRGVASIVTGSVAGQAIVILSYPLLTRLYDPADFGLLTVFTSVVGIVAVASTATLEAAVPLPTADRDAAAVAWAALASVALVSLLTAAVGLVAAEPLARLLGVPALADYWWLVVLTIAAIGAYLVFSEWMVRDRSYGALARRNLLQGMGQVGTQLGFGVAGAGPTGLLLGLGVGRVAAMGGLLSRNGLLRQQRPTLAQLRAAVSRYRRFPQLAMPSALLNSAGLEVPLLLVAALYGDVSAGLLGLTVRVISGPTAIIGQAVMQVFTGESSGALRESKGDLGRTVRTAVRRLLLAGAVPAVLLLVAGPWLFALVFGPQWREAGEYARLLALAYLGQCAVMPVSSTLFLLEQQHRELGWVVLRLALTAGGPLLCGLLGAPVSVAIAALAAGHVVAYAVLYRFCVKAADASDRALRAAPSAPDE